MAFATARLSLPEQCRQVVLLTQIDAVSAAYACALATSPLVPQNCRVVVWDVAQSAALPSSNANNESPQANVDAGKNNAVSSDSSAAPTPSPESLTNAAALSPASAAAAHAAFLKSVKLIESKMRESRVPRPAASVTHMTQFFYGGVSPKLEEIAGIMQRIDLVHGAAADVAVATASGRLAVESSTFVVVLNSQTLGADTEVSLKPYELFLRAVWGVNGHFSSSAAASSASTASLPPAQKRTGSLIILADEAYRQPACTMVQAIAAEVPTTVTWYVQLAYVHALDPPALEFGATAAVVESRTGLSHGGTLPVLCAANAVGVLRHFPVCRSEPATISPVDVALNAALLGLLFLRQGELPECSNIIRPAPASAEVKDTSAAAAAAHVSVPVRHHMGSFAVAESHTATETTLVWGMFGEYLMGYYGRFATVIAAAFPVSGVVTPSPVLQFPFSVRDVVNFGPEPRCPTYLLEGWRAYQQRQRIAGDSHGSAVTRVMQACVEQLDSTLHGITTAARAAETQAKAAAKAASSRKRGSAASSFSLPPYHLGDFNVGTYQYMLRRLTAHYPLMPYHQCVALSAVDWEAYISVVARAALVHLATCALTKPVDDTPAAAADRRTTTTMASRGSSTSIASIAGVKETPKEVAASTPAVHQEDVVSATAPIAADPLVPFGFPEPRRSFTNDIVYHGEERIPPFPSLTRSVLSAATFLHRTAMQPNGYRADMTPGMTPKTLVTILAQPHIQQLMTALAAKDGATRAEVEAQAKKILLIAGDTLNHAQCRTMGLMVREIFKRIYQRVNVNHGAFERLHRQLQMPRVALVFVPLHRSYVDFLILSFLLAEMQAPMPHIVAGDGFLSMGPIATLMRGSGAFFMRRTFRGDPLYAALFKEYVRQMTLSHRPLEFFIEGTRSRTGKTMAPKMGILKFVCDTFFDPAQQELDDVLFLPVSLSYDELLEAHMYAKELLGEPKPKENLSNFFKASSTLQRMHGSINLHMGDAISLRSLKEHPQQCPLPYLPKSDAHDSAKTGGVAGSGGRSGAAGPGKASKSVESGVLSPRSTAVLNTTPAIVKAPSPTPPSILGSVAWHLTYQLQRNIVITPASMVAALLECLSPYYSSRGTRVEGKKSSSAAAEAGEAAAPSRFATAAAVPLAQMEQGVVWLRGILLRRGARLSAEAALWRAERVVKTALGNLYRFAHLSDGMSAVAYKPDDVVTRLGVNISTNQLIHVCIDEALVAVVAQAFGSATTPHRPPTAESATVCGMRAVKSDVLANQTQLLQRLLSTEFPNYASSAPLSFNSWLECTVNRLQRDQPPPMGEGKSVSNAAALASESAAAAAPPSHLQAPSTNSNAALTYLPVTQYYYFLLQLICPHLEALYVVLTAALTLLKAYPGVPLGAADVVVTTQRTCRTLYEEGKLNYAVTANKETLQHYFESLLGLSLLQLDRLPPPPPQPAASGAKAKKASQGAVVYKAGVVGQQKALERLDVLSAQVHKLLWYPAAEAESVVDAEVVKERLLKVYKELAHPAKM